jgi:hypothetical protein
MSPANKPRAATYITVTVLSALLCACASTPTAAPTNPQTGTGAPAAAGTAITSAVTSPLSDLNLTQTSIPAVLIEAQKQPYGTPLDASCTGLIAQTKALDSALGADLDVPASPSNTGLIERGGNLAGDTAGSALKGAAEGLVPFRSWVRKLTGAEQHSRQVAAAIAAGAVRRAYLKGLGQAQHCDWPAAPFSVKL